MLTRLTPICLAASLAFTTPFAQAYNLNLAIKPREEKVLSNSSFWTIHATCQLKSDSKKRIIKIIGNKNVSRVNGQVLNAGQATSMTLYAENIIEVTAEPGAEVTISNMSDEYFDAVCSA